MRAAYRLPSVRSAVGRTDRVLFSRLFQLLAEAAGRQFWIVAPALGVQPNPKEARLVGDNGIHSARVVASTIQPWVNGISVVGFGGAMSKSRIVAVWTIALASAVLLTPAKSQRETAPANSPATAAQSPRARTIASSSVG